MMIRVTYNIPEDILPVFKLKVLDKYAQHYEFAECDQESASKIHDSLLEDEVYGVLKKKDMTTREIYDSLRKSETFHDIHYKKVQRILVALVVQNKLNVSRTTGGIKGTFNLYSLNRVPGDDG